jgi:hypothetical protein
MIISHNWKVTLVTCVSRRVHGAFWDPGLKKHNGLSCLGYCNSLLVLGGMLVILGPARASVFLFPDHFSYLLFKHIVFLILYAFSYKGLISATKIKSKYQSKEIVPFKDTETLRLSGLVKPLEILQD